MTGVSRHPEPRPAISPLSVERGAARQARDSHTSEDWLGQRVWAALVASVILTLGIAFVAFFGH